MTAAKVFINGKDLGEYKGGYTPFSHELTKELIGTATTSLPSKSTQPSGRTFRRLEI